MQKSLVKLQDQIAGIKYPRALHGMIDFLFSQHIVKTGSAGYSISIVLDKAGKFLFSAPGRDEILLDKHDLPEFLMEAVVRGLVVDLDSGVALHAGAISHADKSILIAGPSGTGKSTLTAWLVQNGFGYLTDELVICPASCAQELSYFTRPLTVRAQAIHTIDEDVFIEKDRLVCGDKTLLAAPHNLTVTSPPAGLLLFPQFEEGQELQITALSASSATLRLLENNLNGKNLADGGLSILANLAKQTPAFVISYGDSMQLEDVLDGLVRHILDAGLDQRACHAYFAAFNFPASVPPAPAINTRPEKFPVNEPTPSRGQFKLTIGMATYDDYDGVFFTVQSLRMNNADLMDQIEILVVDNHPDGACAKPLKALEQASKNLRYIPYLGPSGTAVRDFIFAQASGTFVLCLDCHVLLVPGALKQFIEFIDANPLTDNLLQGPLMYDSLDKVANHFEPDWMRGMFGHWSGVEHPPDENAEPFEIPMQGLGLFAARRDSWPGFNWKFRGFGGEEGYIHEKYRQRGDKTLCLPFLQWVHRFQRPMGIPYRITWEDRIRNYMIGHNEVGLATKPVLDHFEELIGTATTQNIVRGIETELANPFNWFASIACINLDTADMRWLEMTERFEELGIEGLVNRVPAIATPENHHIGCALSHRAVIQQARQRNMTNVLVFEDDALFHADTLKNMETVVDELQASEWDIAYLGGHTWGQSFDLIPGFTSLEHADKITCTHAIAYNHTIFDRLLAEVPQDLSEMEAWLKCHYGIDQYFAHLNVRKIQTRPVLSMQRELLSLLPEDQQALFVI